jgi:hypothetical protein
MCTTASTSLHASASGRGPRGPPSTISKPSSARSRARPADRTRARTRKPAARTRRPRAARRSRSRRSAARAGAAALPSCSGLAPSNDSRFAGRMRRVTRARGRPAVAVTAGRRQPPIPAVNLTRRGPGRPMQAAERPSAGARHRFEGLFDRTSRAVSSCASVMTAGGVMASTSASGALGEHEHAAAGSGRRRAARGRPPARARPAAGRGRAAGPQRRGGRPSRGPVVDALAELRRARSRPPALDRSSWASAAAHATGLPRNVLVWMASPADGGQPAHGVGRADGGAERDAAGERLADAPARRARRLVLAREPAAGAAAAGVDLVEDEQRPSRRRRGRAGRARKPGGGTTMPPRPRIGSTMTAPTG